MINPPETPKVAFGSGLERVTLPLSGPCMSSFMRKMMGNVDRSPGPAACVDERDYLIKQVQISIVLVITETSSPCYN